MLLIWFVLLRIFLLVPFANGFDVQLQSVFMVLRHGDRAPTHFYPNDPFKDVKYWPQGVGEMNQRGVKRTAAAAVFNAELYKDFLKETNGFNSRALASTRKRAIETAKIFLENFLRNSDFDFGQNVDIVTDAKMLITTAPCRKTLSVWLNWINGQTVMQYLNSKRKMIEYLGNQTGEDYFKSNPFTLRNLEFLATTLHIEREEYHLPVPEWARKESVINELADLKQHAFLYDWQLPEMQRLRVGLLFNDIVQNMRTFIAAKEPITGKPRFFLYSTHDVNQVLLLQALNLYDQIGAKPTTYSSAIVIELYYNQAKDTNLVRVIYRQVLDSPLTNFELSEQDLIISNCSNNTHQQINNGLHLPLCTFEQFNSVIQSKIPKNWDQECQTDHTEPEMNIYWLIFYSIFSACTIYWKFL